MEGLVDQLKSGKNMTLVPVLRYLFQPSFRHCWLPFGCKMAE